VAFHDAFELYPHLLALAHAPQQESGLIEMGFQREADPRAGIVRGLPGASAHLGEHIEVLLHVVPEIFFDAEEDRSQCATPGENEALQASCHPAAGGTIVSVADHYTYRVHWSADDEEYVGTVAELPSLSWLAEERMEAFIGIQRLVEEVVADMRSSGEEPPVAIADKRYSGKFQVRVPEEVHRRLAVRAAEQGVSLNALASSRLAGD